jgi:hypothetical protein
MQVVGLVMIGTEEGDARLTDLISSLKPPFQATFGVVAEPPRGHSETICPISDPLPCESPIGNITQPT